MTCSRKWMWIYVYMCLYRIVSYSLFNNNVTLSCHSGYIMRENNEAPSNYVLAGDGGRSLVSSQAGWIVFAS